MSEKPDTYEILKKHEFFWKMQNKDEPLNESLSAEPFNEFPTLHEIYKGESNVIVNEYVKEGEHLLVAYLLDERFIVIQNVNTLDVQRYNLIAAKSVSETAYHTWWRYREMKDSKSGRDYLRDLGFDMRKN